MDMKQFTSLNPAEGLPQLKALLETRQRPKNAFGQKQTGWYRIKNLSENDVEVYIYDDIGQFGISADEFVREFSEIRASRITVRINSEGGAVTEDVSIYNAIRRHQAHVTTVVDGMAASIASFILLAGDEVVMSPHSQIIIHDAFGVAMGDAETHSHLAEMLNKMSDDIASLYAAKAGGTVEEWRALMKATTLFSDTEAVEAGLADRIDGEDEEAAVAARLTARQTESPEPIPIDALSALKEGTSKVVKKEPLPAFDFAEALKVGTARA